MEMLLAISAGVALAAACGFRVFIPLLATALAVRSGYLDPSSRLEWIGSAPAVLILGVATLVEVAGYYVPWVDNLLDTIASPAAVVAGTFAAATAFGDIHPALKWAAALIAGGGTAATIQGATVFTRVLSTSTTAGAGNPVVSTLEAAGAVVLSLLAILLPLLALVAVIVLVSMLLRRILERRSGAAI